MKMVAKKTISTIHQCCHGFGRKKNSRSANIFMPCEELNLRSVIETSEKLNGKEFIRAAQKNDVDSYLRKNVTVFLPTDAAFSEFAEQMLESVSNLNSSLSTHQMLTIVFLLEFGGSAWITSSPLFGSIDFDQQRCYSEPYCARMD